MFWSGLAVGLIIGIIGTIQVIKYTMYYIGKHPEMIDKLVDKSLAEVIGKIENKAMTKLDSMSYSSNPFS